MTGPEPPDRRELDFPPPPAGPSNVFPPPPAGPSNVFPPPPAGPSNVFPPPPPGGAAYPVFGAMPPPAGPFYPPYAAQRPGPIQPLGGLATAASVLLGITAAMSLATAFPFFNRASVADRFLDDTTTLRDIENADSLVLGLIVILAVIVIGTGIVFIIWQYRHARNAEALRGPHGLGPGWAIGGWFIPLANFVLPFVQLRQSAKASSGEDRAPGIVTAWTVTFIVAAVVFVGASGTRPSSEDTFRTVDEALNDFVRADRIAGVAMLIYTAAAVLAILMVRTLTQRQDRTIAAASQATPFAPPPPPTWGP